MDVLAYPFRFLPSGRAATVQQGSGDHCVQQIAQFAQTRLNELPLAPQYGIEDPVFRSIDPIEITAGASLYHPGVSILGISSTFTNEGEQAVEIELDPAPIGVTATLPVTGGVGSA